MIVITTPTGQIGRRVLDRILDEIPEGGEPVRVIVRDPSRLDPRTRERVEVVAGSHHDPGVVAEAFTGADTVFWLVPPNFHAENVEGHYLDFTRPACEAIRSRSVERVVGVTSLGRGYEKNAGLLSAAFAMDETIEGTGVSYRALGMPFFMENLLNQVGTLKSQGTFFLANLADRPLATVATRDIATTAAGLLLDGSWSGQEVVPVVSPDDLSPNEMAGVMAEVLGREVRFRQVGGEDHKATMMEYGASEAFAQGMAGMVAAQNDGIYDAGAQTPRSSTSFRQWCEEVLKPAVIE